MKAIIPTGGRGTRMQPLTFSLNKHFIPIGGKPLIFYPVETVIAAGIKEIGVTYNPGYLEEAQSILGDGSRWGVKITYILQEKPIGLANIVQVCEEFLAGESFVFHLGDNIFVDGIKEAVDYFEEKKPNGLVTMLHHSENKRMGVPYFDDSGRLTKYVEKPENPPHDFAVPGLYFGDSNFFKCFKGTEAIVPSARGEYEIPAAFQWMIDQGMRVDVVEYKGKWLDPGKFDDWMEANQFMLEREVTEDKIECEVGSDTTIENNAHIGKNCIIENTQIKGPVVIGDNVMIKDSFIGPFTAISSDSKVEGARIENSILMNEVLIKNYPDQIDSSLIGPGSEIINTEKQSKKVSFFIGAKSKIIV
ncbi:MAG: glucose-1-phosphate thymidylyltransferase [Candidatus Daviesbacteria bacterium]|nr:glucose-1-phosphate thymidylyltransferase [Candidatus Daviesbacteria bacterium]